MSMFRKKPIVIEARRFTGSPTETIMLSGWIGDSVTSQWGGDPGGKIGPELVIHTLEGKMVASVGDWIIKGVNGEFYPCKDDIFQKTYEAVD